MKGARAELPKAIYTAEQVRRLDRIAIDELGISGYELMCRAGEAALEALRSRWPDARRLAILCGAGNNAGDGYVLARLAHERGLEVRAVAVVRTDRLGGDAKRAWQDYQGQGGKVESFSPDCNCNGATATYVECGLHRFVIGVFTSANNEPARKCNFA